jgi:hypothetical protein
MLADRIPEWEAQFVQRGREEGKLLTSLKLLERKFPNAPEKIKEDLKKADSDRLDELTDKIIDAKSVEEIL